MPSEQSRNGDTVLVTYKGFLADGKVFDSNEDGEPISFSLGAGWGCWGRVRARRGGLCWGRASPGAPGA